MTPGSATGCARERTPRTFAEMTMSEKLAVSPSGLAYEELRQQLSL